MAKVNLFEPRLKFLNESAHLLALISPTTSAVLGAEHDRLLQSEELDLQASKKDWEAHRRQVCGACGNLMIPGWSCEVFHESYKHAQKKTKAGAKELQKADKSVVYQCLRCHRKTVQAMQTRPAKHVMLSAEPAESHAQSVVVKESRGKDSGVAKSVNASSKQRAKARKQSGLQAMLAKSKTQSSGGSQGGFGLDLMDLMQ